MSCGGSWWGDIPPLPVPPPPRIPRGPSIKPVPSGSEFTADDQELSRRKGALFRRIVAAHGDRGLVEFVKLAELQRARQCIAWGLTAYWLAIQAPMPGENVSKRTDV